ncbi:MAG: 50S ribosomal protein L22, partial [Acidimicrobiales bacterium]
MPGLKTNERPGVRAVTRHADLSAYKVREVLDLIRGQEYARAVEILEYCDRGAADVIGKVLHSCAANAENNLDSPMSPEEMYVSACYADEGPTVKRWKPRARGRATRIRKRTCHITLILSRMSEEELERRRRRAAAEAAERRARRVAGGRRGARRASAGAPEQAAPAAADEPTTAEEIEGEEPTSGEGAEEAPEVADETADEEKAGEGAEDEEPTAEAGAAEEPAA